MLLPHRHWQFQCPAAVKITIPAVTITVRITADIFVPEDLQRHVLAFELAMDLGPVRLRSAAMTRLRPGRLVERRLKDGIAHLVIQRP
jgi:hypothetical protein